MVLVVVEILIKMETLASLIMLDQLEQEVLEQTLEDLLQVGE
jgi:hypothetical protein